MGVADTISETATSLISNAVEPLFFLVGDEVDVLNCQFASVVGPSNAWPIAPCSGSWNGAISGLTK